MAITDIEEKKKSTNVDEAITDANTDPSNTQVTDEDVAGARRKAGDEVERTIETAGLNTATEMDSKNSGAAGKSVSALFRKITGAPKTASSLGTRYQASGVVRDYNVSDADHLERNSAMAEAALEAVHSNIVREATRGAENSETAIIGVPSDVNVYSEESTIMSETATSRTVLYPDDHPRSRESGTIRQRRNKMLSVSGDYLFASTQYGDGHDACKGAHDYENLLFNELGQYGNIIPNRFIAPKRGRFWVRGFSPLPNNDDPIAQVGTVHRNPTGTGEGIDCVVSQAPANSKGLFDVVDLTPTMDAMEAAVAETAQLLTCNKSKFTLGQVEAIAQLFAQAQRVVDSPNEVIEWPEFADAQRSTLRSCPGLGSDTESLDCFNDYEPFIEFMHYLQESEIMLVGARLNCGHLRETLKFHKGMEGQNAHYPYWRTVFHGDPALRGNFRLPTAVAYAATKQSAVRFNTMAKWVYSMRAFWSDIESYIAVIDEGAAKDRVLSKVRVQKDVIDRFHNMLGKGTVNDPAEMTSAQTIYGGNSIDMVLAFDPNDLVHYTRSYNTAANTSAIVAWPACGYANVFTRTTAANAQTVVYDIWPSWLQILVQAVNSTPFRRRVVQHVPSGTPYNTDADSLEGFFKAGGYAPIQVDLEAPNWFSFYMLEALMCFKERVYGERNQLSGYFRYFRAQEVFKVESVMSDDLMSLYDALDGLENDSAIYYDANWSKPSDFPALHDGAVKENFNYLPTQQLAILHDLKKDKMPDGKTTGAIVLQPNQFDSYVFNTQGYAVQNPGIEAHAFANVSQIEQSAAVAWVSSPDGEDSILFMAGDAAPVIFARDLSLETGAKTVEMLQFDADAGLIGYEDNPDKAMYFDDDFKNLHPFQGYVLMKHRGNYVSETVSAADAANPRNAFARYSFCPVILSQTEFLKSDAADDFFVPNSQARHVALCSAAAGSKNIIRNGKTAVTSREIPSTAFTNIASRPSLYGYERFVPGIMAQVYMSVQGQAGNVCVRGDYTNDPSAVAAASGFAIGPGNAERIEKIYAYGWQPAIIGEDTAQNIEEARNTQGALFTVRSQLPSEWRWYEKQNVFATDGFAGINNAVTDFNVDYQLYRDVSQILARCNFAAGVDLVVYTQEDEGVEYITAGDQNNCVRSQFGRALSLQDCIALKHYFARYDKKALYSFYKAALFTVHHGIPGSIGNAEVEFGYELDAVRHPDTRTRLYRNDTRLFLTDKPVVRLNRNWNAYGMTAPLFYEQFHVNMKA